MGPCRYVHPWAQENLRSFLMNRCAALGPENGKQPNHRVSPSGLPAGHCSRQRSVRVSVLRFESGSICFHIFEVFFLFKQSDSFLICKPPHNKFGSWWRICTCVCVDRGFASALWTGPWNWGASWALWGFQPGPLHAGAPRIVVPQMSAHIPQRPLGAESRWVRKSRRQEGEERRRRPQAAPVLTRRLPH